ncbi:hypothetical protein [Flavobacterium aquicola]|uniref:Tissue inhibitor of metalloproteinase n=1 Tax=Flavobacterium aquicola TaxID=1682742 RepID=A0A3E0ESB7_9FLAO|nr:hypothetical protein [Flavobacterium aquicola]REH01145.1 hypothetical protein C8P67_102404 [Flavobacterium aquicola]
MKKLALLILFTISIAGYSQSLDCSKFKNGKFYNTNFPSSNFVIKDTIMEDFNDDILYFAWTLKWLNDCEYEAVCSKSTNEFITVGDKMIVTVKVIDGDCFEFTRKLIGKKFGDGSDTKSFYSCIKKD